MKYVLPVAIALAILATSFVVPEAEAKGRKTVHVKSYKKKNGTRVLPHKRSPPSKK